MPASASKYPAAPVAHPDAGAAGAAGERTARIDLAMAHRMAVHYGWTNLIYNHISLRVPGEPQMFLFKRHDLMFHEITASNLVKIDMRSNAPDPASGAHAVGFNIHTAVLRARVDVNCVLHTHTTAGMAVAAHGEGLLPISQGAMRFYRRISYHDYEGLSESPDECARIAADLGATNAMIMRNHGLLTCAPSVAQAVHMMYQLVTSCEIQVMTLAMGGRPVVPPPEICEHTAQQWERGAGGAHANHAAYMRIAEAQDPAFSR
jgi:ribulose-5-phosphate 4-epimerase/fuculose-1-phosphate aldolase